MDPSRLFIIVNRINAVFFLLLLVVGSSLILLTLLSSNHRNDNRTVIVEEDKDNPSETLELVLGNMQEIHGHDNYYVELRTRREGGKFSSGYRGGEMRNVLFFIGNKLNSRWLYEKHDYLIESIEILNHEPDERNNRQAQAIYIRAIKHDSNNNQVLDSEDESTIALTRPDGSGYTEILSDADSIIDKETSRDGKYLTVLYQSKGIVVLKKFSLQNFQLVSERGITDLIKAH
ncbi:MAG: hypothetical protein OEX12_08500 [Gammaproteobacteria bacterium]|nr:hypothetical protein [Gammaproteobacteria bacterium]